MALKIPNPHKKTGAIDYIPPYIQLSAGPCNVSVGVMNAMMSQPVTFGNKHFYKVVDEVKAMSKYMFQTKNEYTVLGMFTGNGGNEAIVVNLADPGETIIVATAGVWGAKVADMGRRYQLNVIELTVQPGEVYSFEELEQQIVKHKPVALFVTHGESSGGTLQPLDGLGDICHKYNCLLAVDAVVSLGVEPLLTDEWKLDAVSSATQKGVGAPCGMALLTFSDRAYKRMSAKKHPVPYIFDLIGLGDFWNCYGRPRKYVCTFGFHMLTAVRQALIYICEEGLENCWARHKAASDLFLKKIGKLGMAPFVEKSENRFCGVNCVTHPKDVNFLLLLDFTIEKYNIEFGFGIGPTAGKALRIGFLAQAAQPEVVEHFVQVLEEGFKYCRENASALETSETFKCFKQWSNLASAPKEK